MTYFNRDNLFNYNPIQRGVQGNIGQKGVTGARGDEWELFSSENYLPENDINYFTGNTFNITNPIYLWSGGVLAPNGKIYCVPLNSESVLIIDPKGNTYNLNGITGCGTSQYKWSGGILAPNGKIYCIPFTASSVLVIDPSNDTIDLYGLTGITYQYGWQGGVLSTNNKIYCIPFNSNSVLIIDPINNTINQNGITNIGIYNGTNWTGGVLGTNGFIYGIPYANTSVLVIDPINNIGYTNIAGLTNITSTPINTPKWNTGVLAQNGNIYCVPAGETYSLVIDTKGNTTFRCNINANLSSTFDSKWSSGILSVSGKIFGIPLHINSILVIDPITNTGITIFNNFLTAPIKYNGGVLSNLGIIYGVPSNVNNILQIKTGLPKYPPWMLDAYFNKL